MRAVSLQHCLAVGLLVLLSGCVSGDAGDDAPLEPVRETQSERPPDTVPSAPPQPATPQPATPASGLGAADLLGEMPGEAAPAPDAGAVGGRVFNGPYAVELGSGDKRRARQAMHLVLEWLPVGQMKIWRNPNNGHWGTVTATRTYLDAKGAWCREYRQTVTLGGVENQENGAMCRGTDGSWRPFTS